MTSVFADTFYFLALLHSREERHPQAAESSRDTSLHLVTTEWVLAEFGDAYCHPQDRADFVALYRTLEKHPRVKNRSCRHAPFPEGYRFFRAADGQRLVFDGLYFLRGDE